MSADPDPAASPAPDSAPTGPEKLPLSANKYRYKRSGEPEAGDEAAPPVRRALARGGEISEGPAGPDDESADEIEALDARLRALKAQRDAPRPAAPPREGRGAKYHRLERKQAAPVVPRESGTPAPEVAAPVKLPTPPVIHYAPWHDTTWHPGWLLASGSILALGIVAFFLGRWSNPPITPKETAAVVAPTWTPAQIRLLDNVIATGRAGNPAEAYRQAERLNKQLGPRQDLLLYAHVLQVRAGGMNNAEADLSRSVSVFAPPMFTAAVQDRLGFVFARRRDFRTAADCFAAAAASDPFDALTCYHWGESLRRGGRLAEAIEKFRAALLRLPPEQPESASLRECTALRLRLSQIELGDDQELKGLLDEQMRLPVPSVYWLLTAVAYALQHNDPPTAVAALQKARVVAPADQLDLLGNDYYLRLLAGHYRETESLAAQLTPERRARLDASLAYFIDP